MGLTSPGRKVVATSWQGHSVRIRETGKNQGRRGNNNKIVEFFKSLQWGHPHPTSESVTSLQVYPQARILTVRNAEQSKVPYHGDISDAIEQELFQSSMVF